MDRIDTGMTPSAAHPAHATGGPIGSPQGVPRVRLVNGEAFKVWSGVPAHVAAGETASSPGAGVAGGGASSSVASTFGAGAYARPTTGNGASRGSRGELGVSGGVGGGGGDSFQFTSVLAKQASEAAAARATGPVRSFDSVSRASVTATSSVEGSLASALSNITSLIGAKVSQGVSFEAPPASVGAASGGLGLNTQAASRGDLQTGPQSGIQSGIQSGSQTVPLYRHPADRHTAATAVHAGRILDVNG